MYAAGSDRDYPLEPKLARGVPVFQAITEEFLPRLEAAGIALGEATILAKDWASLIALSRQLREFGTPIVAQGRGRTVDRGYSRSSRSNYAVP